MTSATATRPEGTGPVGAPAAGLSVTMEEGVAVVTIDQPGAAVNVLSTTFGAAVDALLDEIAADASVMAVVLLSGKADCWIAGADIDELAAVTTAERGAALSREGQRVLGRLASLRRPVVAAIHGAALGGGLEVALACTHRIASDHPRTQLGLPEVQLGLLPGAGGTQRLPRLVGLRAALDLMLTGRSVPARKALAMGLVHEVVHPAILRTVAVERARALVRGEAAPGRRRRRTAIDRLLDGTPVGRAVVLRQARARVRRKTQGHYPAPLAILDVVARGLFRGWLAGLAEESRRFGALAAGPVARQLAYLYFATTALKKERATDEGPGAGPSAAPPHPVAKLGIIGAGFMGAGIAAIAVQRRTLVRLRDTAPERLAQGYAAVRAVLDERVSRRRLAPRERDDLLALCGGTLGWDGFANADLVIEAVVEELATKQEVLRAAEAAAPRAVLASNTSTLPIARLAAAVRHPERVLGMHFFSPVPRMPLLEVITTPRTHPEAVATAVGYGRALGKTVIVVRDGPGFYVNRILAPYLNEAGQLLDEGATIEAVDAALVTFGFPVGPLTLLDEVGLDVAGRSGPVLYHALGERMRPPVVLRKVVDSGRLGRKGGSGFYRYPDGRRTGADEGIYGLTAMGASRRAFHVTAIQRRCVLPMLNEAVRCLEDGIIRRPRDGDIGAVFGIGFPPFLGGPFRYLDTLGAADVVRELDALEREHPGRFVAARLLREMAATGARFMGDGRQDAS